MTVAAVADPFVLVDEYTHGAGLTADALASLRVLHTLCQHQSAALAAARAEHGRVESLTSVLAALSQGATWHAECYGESWSQGAMRHRWHLTRVYAETAFAYAASASRLAVLLRTGRRPVAFTDGVRGDDGETYLIADLEKCLPRLRLPASGSGMWLAAEIGAVNSALAVGHHQVLDLVGPLAAVRPDDLIGDQLGEPITLTLADRESAEPRCQHLHDAANALHTFAAACTRAAVLLDARHVGAGKG